VERRHIGDDRAQGRDVDLGIGEREAGDLHRGGVEQRQIALHVDYRVVLAVRIEPPNRFGDAVGAGRVARIGHHRLPARALDRFGNRMVAAGDDNRPDSGRHRAAPDMDDHRRPADIGERLSRQPRRRQSRRDQDDRVLGRGSRHGFMPVERGATTCPVRGIAESVIIGLSRRAELALLAA